MRYIVIIFVLAMNLYSEDFFRSVIKDIEISKDFKTYKEAQISDYKSTEKTKQISLKLRFNKKKLENETYYLIVISDVASLISTNAEYTRKNNILTIKLDKENSKELYFNYKYKQAKKLEFRCDVIDEFEYKYMLPHEGILYGLAYGIIFCAFLYYLIIFFSTRKLAFLYYSFMQLFVLLSLIGFTYVSFLSYPNQEHVFTQSIIDVFETLAFTFTALFAKEILNTKKVMPFINLLFNMFIVLSFIDILGIALFKYSILYDYMSFEVGFLLPVIAGVIAIYKKVDYAFIYTLGWSLMLFVVYLSEKFIITISSIYTIHMVTPLESLIFSFALGLMLKKIVNEKNEKEKFLIHKSKLAAMGEMINNIAHQWKQPLTHLGYINMNLQLASTDEVFDKVYLNKKIIESNEQIDFMTNTIDNFRDFYKPAKEKEVFLISKAVKKSIDIMRPLLKIHDITLTLELKKDSTLTSYENEYSQVILNLISNAKDELVDRNIENPTVTISIDSFKGKSITTVVDNAGGIKEDKLEKVFEPYFTTKDSGSGIGLYMSKTIIDSHFKGELKAKNTKEGASFSIVI